MRFKGKDSYFLLSFDRIKSLEVVDEKFTIDEEFDAATWFKDSYGIVRNDEFELTDVKIRAYGREVFYMRDLPLHHSQEEVETTEGYSDFVVKLRPTADFFTPILSRGAQIKVLEPKWLADEIKAQHQASAELYNEE